MYLNETDLFTLGAKASALASRNRALQNTVDGLSLGRNLYEIISYNNAISQIRCRYNMTNHSYGYQAGNSNQSIDYYTSQRNKHIVLAIVDVISLVLRK